MLKRLIRLTLFCLLASSFGLSLEAESRQASQAPATKASHEPGDEAGGSEIAEKYRAAMGFTGDGSSVKTVELQTEIEVLGRTNKMTVLTERATRRFYQLTEGPNGKMEMGFDGKRVWQKAPFFHGYLADSDPAAKRALQGEEEMPFSDGKSARKLYRLPNETIEGQAYLVVITTVNDPNGNEVQLKGYFDPATYLLRRLVRGAAVTQTTIFDDYRRDENGKWRAYKQTNITPQVTAVIRVISIKNNVPIDPAKFEYQEDSAAPAKKLESGKTEESASPSAAPSAALSAAIMAGEQVIPEAKRLEAFEMTWSKINNTYWEKTFNGVDWQAIHAKYAPLVKAATKSKEFHALLHQMVGELHLSHYRVVPPEFVIGLNTRAGDPKNGGIGVALHWLDGQLVVVDLDKNYPAYASGMRQGFVVTKINGQTPEEIYQESKKKAGYEPREEFARVRAVGEQLSGKLDVPVKLEVLNAQDQPMQLEVKRQARQMGGQRLEFEFEKLDGQIGYIKFSHFFGDLLAKFQAALKELRDTQALIIDLRGNPGGAGDLAPSIANLLCAGEGSLGTLQYRYGSEPFFFKGAGDQAYKGKVVLLVDEHSGSTSEVFSGGLQENKRATIIGAPTAGAVLPSTQQLLPTGGVLVHPIANFQTPKGVVLEGRGVFPDITARLSRQALLAGRDPVRERAIEFIKTTK